VLCSSIGSIQVTEAIKLLLAAAMLAREASVPRDVASPLLPSNPASELALYGVPSMLYFVANNLVYYIQESLSPAVFQLVSQAKTLMTALLCVYILRRTLSVHQWLALATLACATANAVDSSMAPARATAAATVAYPLPAPVGVGLTLALCLCTSFAGVYNEKLLKTRASSANWQNCLMYTWGCVLNGGAAVAADGSRIAREGLLGGFGAWAWAFLILNSLAGLCVSLLLKHCDNIAKTFAGALATVMTLLLSGTAFGTRLTPQLVLSTALVLIALAQYSYQAPAPVKVAAAANDAGDDSHDDKADESLSPLLPRGN
jgi:UDP-sugar transporter A1/2/3